MKRTHGEESLCGGGSWESQSRDARKFIQDKITGIQPREILDLGCGDWNWMRKINFSDSRYLGIDCDDQMIQDNSDKYGSDQIRFEVGDIFSIDLPEVDLVICRDVLFHVRQELTIKLLEKLRSRKRLFLIATSFNNQKKNHEPREYCRIEDWGFYRINLMEEPFNLGKSQVDSRDEEKIPGRSINLFYFL